MMLLQMTETNINALIVSIATLLTAILTAVITGVVAIYLAKINNKASATQEAALETASKVEKVAQKAEEVKTTLQLSDIQTNKRLDDIHDLVNSRFSKQLQISAMALRRIADQSKDEKDEAAAIFAEKAVIEHREEQNKVILTNSVKEG